MISSLTEKITKCHLCSGGEIEELIQLPKFPFTGMYVTPNSRFDDFFYKGVNQGLGYCPCCGHAQLTHIVDPSLVYDQTYTHRTSASSLASKANNFFCNYLKKIFPNQKYQGVVDIGCNDGYLLKLLEMDASALLGIDPIWMGKDHRLTEKIELVGGYADELDLAHKMANKPDLIISAHTFEHVASPRASLEKILSQVDAGTKFLIEVPSFDILVKNGRFDQVFHQHVQYFSLASFHAMLQSLGCSYIAHAFNHSLWGGTMLFAFEKGGDWKKKSPFQIIEKELILRQFHLFRKSLEVFAGLASRSEELFGFGAAQMFPSLAYHIPGGLRNMKVIYDDNESRHGKSYPGFPYQIVDPRGVDFENKDIAVTALDSARPILARLTFEKARRILLPVQVS